MIIKIVVIYILIINRPTINNYIWQIPFTEKWQKQVVLIIRIVILQIHANPVYQSVISDLQVKRMTIHHHSPKANAPILSLPQHKQKTSHKRQETITKCLSMRCCNQYVDTIYRYVSSRWFFLIYTFWFSLYQQDKGYNTRNPVSFKLTWSVTNPVSCRIHDDTPNARSTKGVWSPKRTATNWAPKRSPER